jgi:hypothetical protein
MRKIVGAVSWLMLPLAIIVVAWQVAKDWVEKEFILDN